MPFYRNLSHPGIGTRVSSIPGRFLTAEPPLDAMQSYWKTSPPLAWGPGLFSGTSRGIGAFFEYMTPPKGVSRASLVAQTVKRPPGCGRPRFHPSVKKIP